MVAECAPFTSAVVREPVPTQKSETPAKPRDFLGATVPFGSMIAILSTFISALSFRLRCRASLEKSSHRACVRSTGDFSRKPARADDRHRQSANEDWTAEPRVQYSPSRDVGADGCGVTTSRGSRRPTDMLDRQRSQTPQLICRPPVPTMIMQKSSHCSRCPQT